MENKTKRKGHTLGVKVVFGPQEVAYSCHGRGYLQMKACSDPKVLVLDTEESGFCADENTLAKP